MNKIIILIGMCILLLTGCTPTIVYVETIQEPIQEPITQEESYSNLDVYFIDVGQGDSELITYGDTEMLIDCGTAAHGDTVVDLLRSVGVTELDYLLITHPDADHIGGCYDVLTEIPTKLVITNGNKADTNAYKNVMNIINSTTYVAEEGYTFDIGRATMKVIQAEKDFADQNQNSIVTKLVLNDFSVLFTGDCDRDCEKLLITKDFISSDILKIPHHGSKYGTGIALLNKVNPSIAVIEVGKNNYGHPSWEVLDRLDQEKITMYSTNNEGNVLIRYDGSNYVVNP